MVSWDFVLIGPMTLFSSGASNPDVLVKSNAFDLLVTRTETSGAATHSAISPVNIELWLRDKHCNRPFGPLIGHLVVCKDGS